MRVFVTGATGYVGSAIAARLAKAGHQVHGLTRHAERGESLRALGVSPVVGDLAEPKGYVAEIKNSDAVVHAAAYDDDPARLDQIALEAFRAGVVDGRVRHLIYTSGVWLHGETGDAVEDETATPRPIELVAWRPAHEEVALDLVEHDTHVTVMRPGVVYGGSGGILGDWFREAREKRTLTYPDGPQHWTLVHLDDVAEAYRLALEYAKGRQCYLLVDESHFTVKELAEAAARASHAEPRAMLPEHVLETMGTYGAALLLDQRLTAAKARRELGWVPRHTSFVAEADAMYREWSAGDRTVVA